MHDHARLLANVLEIKLGSPVCKAGPLLAELFLQP